MDIAQYRGRDLDTGVIVHGKLRVFFDDDILESSHIITNEGGEHYVAPTSIAQLVGYDRDEQLIYEGDLIVRTDQDNLLQRAQRGVKYPKQSTLLVRT